MIPFRPLARAAVAGILLAPALVAAALPAEADTLPYENATLPIPQRVADLLGRMTLAEKVGQMTQAERGSVDSDPSIIATDHLGSLLSGGGSVPTPNTPTAWADMVDRYQRAALQAPLHIPILYGIDTVHGDGNMYGATVFPHNIGLGATRDPALVAAVEHIAASETRSTGPQWAFAPCICVARDDRWGRTYESFGEDPALVEQMETTIDGFQGGAGQLKDNDRVLATGKHFAGDGLTTYGTGSNDQTTGNYPIDQGVDQVDRATFDRLALAPYIPAVQQHHVGSVMPSYSDVQFVGDATRTNMHGNGELITGWLKGTEGFDGFVISDYNGIDHIQPGAGTTFEQRVVLGVNAGIDMFMQPSNFAQFEAALTDAVNTGQVSMARIDDAVSRILTKKFELGLFEHPYTDRTHLPEVGDAAHRAVARKAVQESQVLLRNQKHALPIRRNGGTIYVAGSNADDIGNQAGGWTLTWQGGSTNVIPGTTILQGIRQHAGHAKVTYSATASAPVPHGATGVVVVGETPYAEGFGDVNGPQWAYDPGDHNVPRPVKDMQLAAADKTAVDRVCSAAAKCIVVVVSGRPLQIDPQQLSEADALVAAWLPGSEGEGVADDLFGTAPYTGKLPVTWPRTVSQEPINVGDPSYDPLYPYGFGLHT
ncbi:MAG: glycoside hydrolase family 3 protein [Jatrophihabitans sp.]|uniref:glycoside hydrolase family 3 protein n=1 Tax=Jatrophihabitans sp. TaxID=1932789 RepID=UPI003914026E